MRPIEAAFWPSVWLILLLQEPGLAAATTSPAFAVNGPARSASQPYVPGNRLVAAGGAREPVRFSMTPASLARPNLAVPARGLAYNHQNHYHHHFVHYPIGARNTLEARPIWNQPNFMPLQPENSVGSLSVPKPDAPKPDAPKPETPKPEAPKPEAPNPEAPSGRNNNLLVAPSVNLSELCSPITSNAEKQLMSYIAGLEAITGTIQELDEVMQQDRQKVDCNLSQALSDLTVSPQPFNVTGEPPLASYVDSGPVNSDTTSSFAQPESSSSAPSSIDIWLTLGEPNVEPSSSSRMGGTNMSTDDRIAPPTESFFDPPTSSSRLARAERDSTSVFGMPADGHPPAAAANAQAQASEDLAKASNDLKALRRDLSRAAEWLRQTNHTVHGAMLRVLLTYVASIERRIDSERNMFAAQARSALLKSKIALVKEKLTSLLEKLRNLIPARLNPVERHDSNVVTAGTSKPAGVSTEPPAVSMAPATPPVAIVV